MRAIACRLTSYYHAHPDDPFAANNLAWILAQQGRDLDRALKLAKLAASARPASAVINDTLGGVYRKRGDKEMAVSYAKRATQIAPENATYHYHLGRACREAGQMEPARAAFAKAVELAPTPRPQWYDEARAGAQGP